MRCGARIARAHYASRTSCNPSLGHTFNDDLSCLPAAATESAFHTGITAVEHRAGSDIQLIAAATDWLNQHGMATETLRWLGTLPPDIQANMRVQIARSEALLAMRDWKALSAFLKDCHWEDCEFLRRAMQVRCERELAQPWEPDWKQLAQDTQRNPQDILLLAQLVIGWGWRDEELALLWDAARRPVTASRALEILWRLYAHENDTRELLRVAKAQLDIDPASPTRKNNFAFLSLLLDGPSQIAERLAREASTADPNAPEWAATYAYALHLAGNDPEAKKVLANLAPATLKRPGVALYSAIILAANGDNSNARNSIARLNTNGMLPEERKLAAELAGRLGVVK